MTDHQKFNKLLKELGISRKELAQLLGMKYSSITSLLATAKPLPTWAKSMLITAEKLPRERTEMLKSQILDLLNQ